MGENQQTVEAYDFFALFEYPDAPSSQDTKIWYPIGSKSLSEEFGIRSHAGSLETPAPPHTTSALVQTSPQIVPSPPSEPTKDLSSPQSTSVDVKRSEEPSEAPLLPELTQKLPEIPTSPLSDPMNDHSTFASTTDDQRTDEPPLVPQAGLALPQASAEIPPASLEQEPQKDLPAQPSTSLDLQSSEDSSVAPQTGPLPALTQTPSVVTPFPLLVSASDPSVAASTDIQRAEEFAVLPTVPESIQTSSVEIPTNQCPNPSEGSQRHLPQRTDAQLPPLDSSDSGNAAPPAFKAKIDSEIANTVVEEPTIPESSLNFSVTTAALDESTLSCESAKADHQQRKKSRKKTKKRRRDDDDEDESYEPSSDEEDVGMDLRDIIPVLSVTVQRKVGYSGWEQVADGERIMLDKRCGVKFKVLVTAQESISAIRDRELLLIQKSSDDGRYHILPDRDTEMIVKSLPSVHAQAQFSVQLFEPHDCNRFLANIICNGFTFQGYSVEFGTFFPPRKSRKNRSEVVPTAVDSPTVGAATLIGPTKDLEGDQVDQRTGGPRELLVHQSRAHKRPKNAETSPVRVAQTPAIHSLPTYAPAAHIRTATPLNSTIAQRQQLYRYGGFVGFVPILPRPNGLPSPFIPVTHTFPGSNNASVLRFDPYAMQQPGRMQYAPAVAEGASAGSPQVTRRNLQSGGFGAFATPVGSPLATTSTQTLDATQGPRLQRHLMDIPYQMPAPQPAPEGIVLTAHLQEVHQSPNSIEHRPLQSHCIL